jgi:hypothetical protein
VSQRLGYQPVEAYREAALAAGATQTNDGPPPMLEAAAKFGRLFQLPAAG